MPAPLLEWTAEMARALPDDGNRYEVLDGALHVTPAPRLRHQWALTDLFRRIDAFVERERLGRTMMSPADIEYSPRRLVQPDLFVVPFTPGQPPREWTEVRDLLLVIEVLSPGTAHVDRHRKRRIYLEEGVPTYWIVDLEAQRMECWRLGAVQPTLHAQSIRWQPREDTDALEIDLLAFFAGQP